jgi:transcriptional regulator with XRE-family HTH domain
MNIHSAARVHDKEGKAMRLREIRRAAGMTQRELARRAGLSRSAVSHVEQGRYSPSARFAGKVCRALAAELDTPLRTWEIFPGSFTAPAGADGAPAPKP